MLSYNVASLLRAAPGTTRRYDVDIPAWPITQEVELAAPIEGEVKLARTGRSILATVDISTAIAGHCARCLGPVVEPIDVHIEEEALPSIDIDTGQPVDRRQEPDVLRLDANHELNLADPVRDAISLAEPIAVLCRPDCRGLCPVCGVDLNQEPAHGHDEEEIDPRLAALADWQERSEPH